MAFPFSIKYSSSLKGKVSPEDYPMILKQISDFIVDKPAEDIVIENNGLSFKPAPYRSNWNILQSIDRGKFGLDEKEEQVVLTYEFFMYKLFMYTTGMAIFMGVFMKTISFGIASFLWLCGMNWIIALLRHKAMFNELVTEINSVSDHLEESAATGTEQRELNEANENFTDSN